MKNPLIWILVAIIVVAAAWFFFTREDAMEMEEVAVVPRAESVSEPEEPEHPVEDIEVEPTEDTVIETEPLPELSESDPVMIAELSEWLGNETLQRFVVTEQVIGRAVATVDSLTSPQVARKLWPVKPASGTFKVLESDDEAVISPENAARYQPYVELARSMDTEQMVALYKRYYPLFQEAYRDLGYPDGYFNDRAVEVIDHLLQAPEPDEMPEVVKSEAVWVYENPEYEQASIGQKLLMRLEPEDAAAMKEKLRALRAALVGMDIPEVESPGEAED